MNPVFAVIHNILAGTKSNVIHASFFSTMPDASPARNHEGDGGGGGGVQKHTRCGYCSGGERRTTSKAEKEKDERGMEGVRSQFTQYSLAFA